MISRREAKTSINQQVVIVRGEPQLLIPGRDGGALVKSKSETDGWHLVGFGQCDCLGYQYRGRCRHLDAVAAYNGLDREAELAREAIENDQDRPSTIDDGEYMTISEYLERRASGRE